MRQQKKSKVFYSGINIPSTQNCENSSPLSLDNDSLKQSIENQATLSPLFTLLLEGLDGTFLDRR